MIGALASLTGGAGSLIGSLLDKGVDTVSDLIHYLMPEKANTKMQTGS
jgi:hypothetical protein